MAQITIASKKKYQAIKNFVDGIETQTFDVPDETTTAEIQNTASIEADKYVSVRRFWAGISRFLALAQTFLAKITFQVAPRFNSTTASLPLKVDANNDLISGQITNTDIEENAVTNPKLAQPSPNTIKSNPTNAPNNVQDLAINANAFVGRLDELNSGNLTSVPVAKMLKGKTTLIDGGRIVFDTRINANTVATANATNAGTLSSVPIKADTSITGQCRFYTGQIGDNAEINYIIIF